MKERKDLLSRDDWVLTLNGLKGQRVSLLLQLYTLECAIVGAEREVKTFPEPKKPDTNAEGEIILEQEPEVSDNNTKLCKEDPITFQNGNKIHKIKSKEPIKGMANLYAISTNLDEPIDDDGHA